MRLHGRLQIRRRVLQQIQQVGFECGIELAAASILRWRPGLGASARPSSPHACHWSSQWLTVSGCTSYIPASCSSVAPLADSQDRLRALAQAMGGPLTIELLQGRALRVRERGNELSTRSRVGILPDGEIPGFFCTTTRVVAC